MRPGVTTLPPAFSTRRARAAGISASTASMMPKRMPTSRLARSFWLGSSTSPPLMTRSNLSFGPIAARTPADTPDSASADAPATNLRLDIPCMGSPPCARRLRRADAGVKTRRNIPSLTARSACWAGFPHRREPGERRELQHAEAEERRRKALGGIAAVADRVEPQHGADAPLEEKGGAEHQNVGRGVDAAGHVRRKQRREQRVGERGRDGGEAVDGEDQRQPARHARGEEQEHGHRYREANL